MFQYNYKDLAKFFEDVKYLNKYSGGDDDKPNFLQSLLILQAPSPINGKPSMIVLVIFAILNIIVYAIILYSIYLVYYLIFKGYPKFLPDLLTFHIGKQVDLDKLISRNNVLFDAFQVLIDPNPQCASAYYVYNKVYGGTFLKQKTLDVEKVIQTNYNQYKYDEKYKRAFREYYYFFYKLYNGGIVKDTSTTKPDSMTRIVDISDNAADRTIPIAVDGEEKALKHYPYYSALRNYLIFYKEYDTSQKTGTGKQSTETQLWNIYSKDKMKKYNLHQELKEKVSNLAAELKIANDTVNKKTANVLPYLVLPSNLDEIKKINIDFNRFGKQIESGYIYAPLNDAKFVPFERLNEYSWYIAEVTNYIKNGNMFSTLIKNIGVSPSPRMTHYMNLPVKQRKEANMRLKLGLDTSMMEFINKLPILSHIYFNGDISDKAGFYGKVMDAYKTIMTVDCVTTGATNIDSMMMKLDIVGGNFKKLVNAINIANLYLNVYSHELTKLYEKRYSNEDDFLKELWMPYAKDMVFNKVILGFVKYWKDSWIGPPFPTKYYKEFSKKYKFIESTMSDVVKNTWKRLFTSSDPGKPQPAESMPSE